VPCLDVHLDEPIRVVASPRTPSLAALTDVSGPQRHSLSKGCEFGLAGRSYEPIDDLLKEYSPVKIAVDEAQVSKRPVAVRVKV
jgi:hypothetical protein